MCSTSRRKAGRMSFLCANRFARSGFYNFGVRSKSHGLRSEEYGRYCKISHPHHWKMVWTQGAVYFVALSWKFIALSWKIIALFRSAGRFLRSIRRRFYCMICSTRNWQCGSHEQDDTLEYLGCHMPKWSWPSWVIDSVETCVFVLNHANDIHLISSLDPFHTLLPRFHQYIAIIRFNMSFPFLFESLQIDTLHKTWVSSSSFVKCGTLSMQKYYNVRIIPPKSNALHVLKSVR